MIETQANSTHPPEEPNTIDPNIGTPERQEYEPNLSPEGTNNHLEQWLQNEGPISPQDQADVAREIVALRKNGQERRQRAGKVKEYVTNSEAARDDPDDTENVEEELNLLNTIMKQISVTGDGEGESPTKEDLLRIYLGFYAEREIKLSVRIEGDLNVTLLL